MSPAEFIAQLAKVRGVSMAEAIERETIVRFLSDATNACVLPVELGVLLTIWASQQWRPCSAEGSARKVSPPRVPTQAECEKMDADTPCTCGCALKMHIWLPGLVGACRLCMEKECPRFTVPGGAP